MNLGQLFENLMGGIAKHTSTDISIPVFEKIKFYPKIRLAGAFDSLIKDDKMIYGCEVEGKWLECGNKLEWLKSNFYLSLKHPKYGEELKSFLKKETEKSGLSSFALQNFHVRKVIVFNIQTAGISRISFLK